MKLHLTNRRYSSWSLRGWLAAKLSGLPFEEVFVDIYADDWEAVRTQGVYGTAAGKVLHTRRCSLSSCSEPSQW